MMRVAIAGGSGYVGGEVARLLLAHPHAELVQITSERQAGQFLHRMHPNLRGYTDLRFTKLSELGECDLLLLALPHGRAAGDIERFAGLAPRIIDCSADFRLRDGARYERWYGDTHPAPEWLDRFVYGLPEVAPDAIAEAKYVSGVGCNATAVNLALLPLIEAGLVDSSRPVFAEVKVGSSEGGRSSNEGSHHPERSGAVRSYAPVGHRHTAEVHQVSGLEDIHLSITAIEMVRGAMATVQTFARSSVQEKDLWRAYRAATEGRPFLRVVHDRSGIFRHPDPKLLAGTNYADVGWGLDPESGRIVALCAIDNLMKGAAGTAIQCMNLMHGFEESLGLDFPGLHPI